MGRKKSPELAYEVIKLTPHQDRMIGEKLRLMSAAEQRARAAEGAAVTAYHDLWQTVHMVTPRDPNKRLTLEFDHNENVILKVATIPPNDAMTGDRKADR